LATRLFSGLVEEIASFSDWLMADVAGGMGAFVVSGEVLTERLRLVPIGLEQVADLVTIHADPWIVQWYAGRWTVARAQEFALVCARGWTVDGVGKWIAYGRWTGELVGRGGLSRVAASAVRSQVAVLVGPAWTEQRLEPGWAVREKFRGKGIATEIGGLGLASRLARLGPDRSFRLPSATTGRPGTSWSAWACDGPAKSPPVA
jgi:RimJ/RimL family protein N-acetyltransferase